MSALPSVAFQPAVWRFENTENALEAITGYETGLCENAARRRSKGMAVTDQEQPEEAFCLLPAHPQLLPLAIVGGMGPLAGAMAFRQACHHFGNSRVIVLYQACSVPDRSTVILSGSAGSSRCRDVAIRLTGAIRLAANLAGHAEQPVRCILACNSAHYFWNLLPAQLRTAMPRRPHSLEMVSLVDASREALQLRSCRNALLLATEGARVGQVFSAPFRDAGIGFEEPSPALSHLLMRMIFEGMKSLDESRAIALGNEFFEAILANGRDYDCVLAGCTEIPLTIDLLRIHGNPSVAAFLSRVKIVDPLAEALNRA